MIPNKNAVDKPLQRDPSFWIVAVVLVGAATALQLYFGVPWFQQRLALVKPAPRSLPVQQPSVVVRPAGNLPALKKANP